MTQASGSLISEDPHHKSLSVTVYFVKLLTLECKPYIKYLYHNGDNEAISSKLNTINWR